MNRAILLLNLVLTVTAAPAQTAVQAWVQRYNGPENGDDSAQAMVVDGSNNVIVTGPSTGSGSSLDYLTIKYSNAGVPLWTNRYNGPGNSTDYPFAIAVNSSNNVIVTGSSMGSGSSKDYATIQYSTEGVPLWTNRYNGPGNDADAAYGLAVDGSNDVIVTGYSFGTNTDYTTIKYSSSGVPLWTNRYHRPGNGTDEAYALAVDGSNNAIVTGWSRGSDSGDDYGTIKYSSSGVPLWTNRFGNIQTSASPAVAVVVDHNSNVFVASQWSTVNTPPGTEYCPLVEYSSAGLTLWTNLHYGSIAWHRGTRTIEVDGSNNLIVSGDFYHSNGGYDFATVKYSGAGVPVWTNFHGGPGNIVDAARSVAVDGDNNVIVTGVAWNGTNHDFATIAYSSVGLPLWTNRYNGPGNGFDDPYGVAVDRNGNVFVTGYSWNGTNYDFATIKYSVALPPIPLNFQTVENQLMLTWTNAAFGLQSAPAIAGTFTNLPGATSPYTNPITGAQQFFRLISN